MSTNKTLPYRSNLKTSSEWRSTSMYQAQMPRETNRAYPSAISMAQVQERPEMTPLMIPCMVLWMTLASLGTMAAVVSQARRSRSFFSSNAVNILRGRMCETRLEISYSYPAPARRLRSGWEPLSTWRPKPVWRLLSTSSEATWNFNLLMISSQLSPNIKVSLCFNPCIVQTKQQSRFGESL